MFIVLSLLILAVGLDQLIRYIPGLTPTALPAFLGGGAYYALDVVDAAWMWIRPRLWYLGVAIGIYSVILMAAVVIRYPWFTFFVAMVGVIPAMSAAYALHLVRQPLAKATAGLNALGGWLWKRPTSLAPSAAAHPVIRFLLSALTLPINAIYIPFGVMMKATGGVIHGIGQIVDFVDTLAHKLARGLATVAIGLECLAVMCLVDGVLGWHIVDPLVLAYLGLALGIYLMLRVLHQVPGVVQVFAWLAYAGLGLLVASRYISYETAEFYTYVYWLRWPMALCIVETLVVLMYSLSKHVGNPGTSSSHGHGHASAATSNPVRRSMKPVIALAVIWTLQFPYLTGSDPMHLYEARELARNYWVAHMANTKNMRYNSLEERDKLRAGVVNPDSLKATLRKEVETSVKLDNDQEELQARLEHRIPTTAIWIDPRRTDWTPLGVIPSGVRIRVQGTIQGVGPGGNPLVVKGPGSMTVMETLRQRRDPRDKTFDPYRAFLLWSEHSALPQIVADGTPVCESLGESRAWFNELLQISGQRTFSVFHYNNQGGGFSFWVQKDPEVEADCATKARL